MAILCLSCDGAHGSKSVGFATSVFYFAESGIGVTACRNRGAAAGSFLLLVSGQDAGGIFKSF